MIDGEFIRAILVLQFMNAILVLFLRLVDGSFQPIQSASKTAGAHACSPFCCVSNKVSLASISFVSTSRMCDEIKFMISKASSGDKSPAAHAWSTKDEA